MKKIIAMILALVTMMSLCACGAAPASPTTASPVQPGQSQSVTTQPEATQPEATQPAQPQIPDLDMFVGKWNIVEENFLTEIATFTIHADGTLEKNGEILTWTAQQAHPDRDYDMILRVEYPTDPGTRAFDLYLTRTPENTFAAQLRKSQFSNKGDDFYREGDYEVITLTDENAVRYLQQMPETNTFIHKKEGEYQVQRNTQIRMKEGLGALSRFSGTLVFEISYVQMWLNESLDGFTEGDVTGTSLDDSQYANIGEYSWEYTYNAYWFGNAGDVSLKNENSMHCRQLVGTQDVSGVVFIPVA